MRFFFFKKAAILEKRWGHWTQRYQTRSIHRLVQGKRKGCRVRWRNSNLQKWKYLFSSSAKWPYWLEPWEAVRLHHMTLIAANLYVCVCVCVCVCVRARVCGVQRSLREWKIRRSYRAYGGELRRGGRGQICRGQMSKRRYYRPHYSHSTRRGYYMVYFRH